MFQLDFNVMFHKRASLQCLQNALLFTPITTKSLLLRDLEAQEDQEDHVD